MGQYGENGEPIQPPVKWLRRARSGTCRAVVEQGAHDFDAKIYGNRAVRTALEKLFHGKCAYCETPLVRHDWDVDHFRPKGSVKESPGHPGYYWLGYKWQNLFPSCKFCNQKRKDVPTWDDSTGGSGRGKADHFPLADESQRIYNPDGDISVEDPLLINPCLDDPSQYLTFNPLGEAIGIGDKGAMSCDLYHLNERRLVGWRRQRMNESINFMKLKRQIESRPDFSGPMQALQDMEEALTGDQSKYAAVSRAVIKEPERFGL